MTLDSHHLSGHSPIAASAPIRAQPAASSSVVVASVLGVIFVVIISLSWYGYQRYFGKNSSNSNSTKKSRYKNISKLSNALSSSFSSVVGKSSSSRELGLTINQDKDARGGSPLRLNTNSSKNVNYYGSSSNHSFHATKISGKIHGLDNSQRNLVGSCSMSSIGEVARVGSKEKPIGNSKIHGLNNSQRNLVGSSSLSPKAELAGCGLKGSQGNLANRAGSNGNGSQRNLLDTISMSPSTVSARVVHTGSQRNLANLAGQNGSQRNLLETISMSPSTVSSRTVHHGSQRNFIDNRSTLPEVRNARPGPNVGQRNDREGAPGQKNSGSSNSSFVKLDNARDVPSSRRLDELEKTMTKSSSSMKVLPKLAATGTPRSPTRTPGLNRTTSQ